MKKILVVFILVLQACSGLSPQKTSQEDIVNSLDSQKTEQNFSAGGINYQASACRSSQRVDIKGNNQIAMKQLIAAGQCQIQRKNYSMAIMNFNLVIHNAHDKQLKREALVSIAGVKFYQGYDKEGISFLKKAQKIRKSLETSYQLAELYIRYGSYQHARDEVSSFAGQLDSRILKVIGITALLEGNHKEALLQFEQINHIERSQDDSLTLHYSWALFLDGQYKKSKNFLNLSQLKPNSELAQLKEKLAKELEKELLKAKDIKNA